MPTTSASSARLARHIDFLARLHVVFAWFNAIIGFGVVSFGVSAALLRAPAGRVRPGAELAAGVTSAGFLLLGSTALVWAGVHWWCGRALARRDPRGRWFALALATLDAILFPLGTMLAGYALWVLLREDARRRFEVGLPGGAGSAPTPVADR